MYVRLIGIEQARSRSLFGQLIIGIAQGALIDREAAAADTGAHLIAEPGETCDAIIQFVAPFGRKMRPIGSGDSGAGGQGLEPVPDGGKRNAGTLGALDDGNGSTDTAPVPTLISIGSHAHDESLSFVEMQSRERYACQDRQSTR